MGNGLLCCSTGLPVSLTVLLSSPRGLLTPSNDCFPFRNGIFLDKSISCSSSPTLWQISDSSRASLASLPGHINPTPAASPEMRDHTLPALRPGLTPGAGLEGGTWWRLSLRVGAAGNLLLRGCPFPPCSPAPSALLEGGGLKVSQNMHLS